MTTEPYYHDESVQLWHGDCLELHGWLTAAVLVTDPPYGISAQLDYGRGGKYGDSLWVRTPIAGDQSLFARDLVMTWWGDRPGLVFGSWKAAPVAAARAALVWDKGLAAGMGDLSIPWKPNWELIYVVGVGFTGPRDSGILTGNVVTWTSSGREHPNMKPVGLMSKLIDKCPSGLIADPFAGSGSTLVAAKALGRKAIGVEIEERYCEIAAERLAQGAFHFGAVS